MGLEIERKFLVVNEQWREIATSSRWLEQGYLARSETCAVRVRVSDDTAWLTIKSAISGAVRQEYEYSLPLEQAREMLGSLCAGRLLSKRRFGVPYAGFEWEVDVFEGDNAGLVVAEIELPNEQCDFERPAWVGEEVTGQHRYYNAELVVNPYRNWRAE